MTIDHTISDTFVRSTIETFETRMRTEIDNNMEPPRGNHEIVVERQVHDPYPICLLTNSTPPQYLIRLLSVDAGNAAAAAYEFAHELCHVWLGVRPSNALAEIICECASWYFTEKIQAQPGVPYRHSLEVPFPHVNPVRNNGKVVVPLGREPNHNPLGRMAMVRLAKDHIVPWMNSNPGFWQLLPRLGFAMGATQHNAQEWEDTCNQGAIIGNFVADTEGKDLISAFFDIVNEHAVFQK